MAKTSHLLPTLKAAFKDIPNIQEQRTVGELLWEVSRQEEYRVPISWASVLAITEEFPIVGELAVQSSIGFRNMLKEVDAHTPLMVVDSSLRGIDSIYILDQCSWENVSQQQILWMNRCVIPNWRGDRSTKIPGMITGFVGGHPIIGVPLKLILG